MSIWYELRCDGYGNKRCDALFDMTRQKWRLATMRQEARTEGWRHYRDARGGARDMCPQCANMEARVTREISEKTRKSFDTPEAIS
jgi:hypothetical protein